MNISVFGLGYVGCVTIGCLSNVGNKIIGVDINQLKVSSVQQSKPTIYEKGLEELFKKGVSNGLIEATLDLDYAINNSEIAMICIGTPTKFDGKLDISKIEKLCKEISENLKYRKKHITLVIRSTVIPGTYAKLVKIIEKVSSKKHSKDFSLVLNPEFIREGTAINDFFFPPYTIVASKCKKSINKLSKLYKFLNCDFIKSDVEVVEMIKLLNNSFHALKVAFANEIGRICKSSNINSIELINIFIKDTKLNISPKYLKPGFSYGGSCLPKDLKALNKISSLSKTQTPILKSISTSNENHTDFVYKSIIKKKIQKIGIFGISFKKDTDDLRSSPSLALINKLLKQNYKLCCFDYNLDIQSIIGSNKLFSESIPTLSHVLTKSLKEFLNKNELIVLVHQVKKIDQKKFLNSKNIYFLDLAENNFLLKQKNYQGICW